jgi:para-nitrobenzyl esterase
LNRKAGNQSHPLISIISGEQTMKPMLFGLLAAAALTISGGIANSVVSGSANGSVKVKIDAGTLVGLSESGVNVFKGVPFSKAPVGDLRFKPPQKPAGWKGDRDATKFQLPCPQPVNADGRPNGGGVSGETSEDCLYLNVWAPKDAKNAPVMLWLYGGAGYLGAGHLGAYDGTSFAKSGVIIVTINYRLGLLGNFAHPAITKAAGPNEELANYALMDAIAGLEWVKRNIAAFGGNANNVTLFGQSAGGSMVSRLLSSPRAKGLFHKAIVHSGANLGAGITLAEAEKQGAAAATALGLPGETATLEQLRAVPVQKILDTAAARQGIRGANDGRVKTINTRDGFTNGGTADVPLIVGSNNGEGGLEGATTMVNLAASGAPSFQYFFTYVPDWRKTEQPNGAPHSAELPYAFASLATARTGGGSKVTAKDREVAARINSCWVAFAKAPVTARSLTCADGFVWPARTKENDAAAIFDERPAIGKASELKATAPARTGN